jgi:hypothetical protein
MNERENKKSDFIKDIIGCLVSPRSSFKSIMEKPSLKKATLLILVIAIVAAWASFNYRAKLPLQLPVIPGQGTPVGSGQFTQVMMIMSALMALIGIFGTWLISSVLVHSISRPLGGKEAFKSMLTLAGYASVPLLLQHVLRLADSFMASQEALQLTATLQLSADPLLNSIAGAVIDVFTIFRLWSIVLLIVAVRENYKISTVKSMVTVVLSYILIVFFFAVLPLK